MFSVPNVLTISRILIVPFVVLMFYIESDCSRVLTIVFFIIACCTDYLDGYLARAWGKTSKLGTALDPLADKLLVAVTLVLLAGFHYLSKIELVPVVVILAREVFISDLRILSKVSLNTTKIGRWKTTLQMLSITLLLMRGITSHSLVSISSTFMLWFASLITIYTAHIYVKKAFRSL